MLSAWQAPKAVTVSEFSVVWTRAKGKRVWLIDGACVRNDEQDSVKLSLSGLVESLHQLGNNEKRAQKVSRLWRRS